MKTQQSNAIHVVAKTVNPELTPNRQSILDDLFKSNYAALTSLLYDLHPKMLFANADSILAALAAELSNYRGEITQEPFCRWTSRFVKRKARQFMAAEQIIKANSGTIFYAIRDGMSCFAKDAAIDYDDLKQEINLLILRYALSLSKPGTASLKTRLNALISQHCWRYHIRKRKRRLEIVTQYGTTVAQRGIEVLTPAEIASQRWEDGEPDYCHAGMAA